MGSRIVLSYLRNLPNKTASAVAEVGEGRGRAEGTRPAKRVPDTAAGPGASSVLARVREVARRDKGARFTALRHHVDLTPTPGGLPGDPPEGGAGGGRGRGTDRLRSCT